MSLSPVHNGPVAEEEAVLLEEEEEEEREDLLLADRMTYLTGAEESTGPVVHRLSTYSAYSSKRRPTGMSYASFTEPSRRVPRSVWVIFALSALTMWSECIIDFIVYYLILDKEWNSEVYGTITAIQKFVPVVMNPFWVAMSEIIGLKAVCILALLFAADGIVLLAFSPSKLLFAWGAILAACQAIRPLRTSYVLMATHRDIRTKCTAYLNFSTDSMRMMGALTAKYWDYILPLSLYTVADRHRMTTLTSFAICMLNVLMMALLFRKEVGTHGSKKGAHSVKRKVTWTRNIPVRYPDGTIQTVDGEHHAMFMSALTALYFLLHSATCAVYFVSNMPVLCSVFKLEEDYVQNIKLIQELAAIPAPLLIVWLDNLSDRTLLMIGFLINTVGITVFAHPWLHSALQPLFGMILIRAAQPFFFTTACSGFSKMMGVRSSGYTLAMLTSISALGTSLGSWVGADFVLRNYGTWWFFVTALPSLLAMAIVFSPMYFPRMAEDDPLTVAVIRQWQLDEEHSRYADGDDPRLFLNSGKPRNSRG